MSTFNKSCSRGGCEIGTIGSGGKGRDLVRGVGRGFDEEAKVDDTEDALDGDNDDNGDESL